MKKKNILSVQPLTRSVCRNDLRDWQEATRLKAVQLLYMMVWQAEEEVTMHAEKVFDCVVVAAADEAAAIVRLAHQTADLLGYMLGPKAWAPLLLARLQEASAATSLRGNLILLAGMVGGAQRHSLRPCLEDVAFCLAADAVCRDLTESHQTAVLECSGRLLAVSQEDCSHVAAHVFRTVLTVLAAAATEGIREMARGQMRKLATLCDLGGEAQLLYRQNMGVLLKEVAASSAGWSAYAYERLIFEALLHESGPAVGYFTEAIMGIFKTAVSPERSEPECRLRLFILLARMMLNLAATLDSQGQFRDCLSCLLDDVIYPALRWQGGRTAMAIRASATSALLSLIAAVESDPGTVTRVANKVDSRLIGLFRDDCDKTRKMALQAMGRILRSLSDRTDDVEKLVPRLEEKLVGGLAAGLKERLEDEQEVVMMEAVKCSLHYFNYLNESDPQDERTEALIDSLVLHMDSDNPEVRLLVLNSLQRMPVWLISRTEAKVAKAVLSHCHKEEASALAQHYNSMRIGRKAH
jgi:hypothetical protein